ncbi:unnamed protein product [marine sediment metagenome]|uniref:Uncharacterized protein n=1 Tax=marine sediment metagenome TaxID=412755 RepID=X1PNB9_9ZZZZ
MVDNFDNMDWLEEEPYFEEAVAKAFNGEVISEDGTTYVTFGKNKLHIVSGDKFKEIICYWKNDLTGALSSGFMDGKTKNRIWLAVDAAKEVINND